MPPDWRHRGGKVPRRARHFCQWGCDEGGDIPPAFQHAPLVLLPEGAHTHTHTPPPTPHTHRGKGPGAHPNAHTSVHSRTRTRKPGRMMCGRKASSLWFPFWKRRSKRHGRRGQSRSRVKTRSRRGRVAGGWIGTLGDAGVVEGEGRGRGKGEGEVCGKGEVEGGERVSVLLEATARESKK